MPDSPPVEFIAADDFEPDPRAELPERLDPILDEHAAELSKCLERAVTHARGQPRRRDQTEEAHRHDQRGRVAESLRGCEAAAGWNTHPFGDTSEGCKPRLLVWIDDDGRIAADLKYALDHLTRCPKTEFITLSLADRLPSWLKAWREFRWTIARRWPGVAVRVEVRSHPTLCFFDAFGSPVSPAATDKDNLPKRWGSLAPTTRNLLRSRVALLDRLGIAKRADCSFVGKHTGQPQGCGARADLSFGRHTGTNIDSWSARIYLDARDPLVFPLGFPRQMLQAPPSRGDVVWGRRPRNEPHEPNEPWRPRDLAVFETNPAAFIDPVGLIARLP